MNVGEVVEFLGDILSSDESKNVAGEIEQSHIAAALANELAISQACDLPTVAPLLKKAAERYDLVRLRPYVDRFVPLREYSLLGSDEDISHHVDRIAHNQCIDPNEVRSMISKHMSEWLGKSWNWPESLIPVTSLNKYLI